MLPYAGTINFQASFTCLAYDPKQRELIVDVGVLKAWIIPLTGDYFLSGTLSIAKEPGEDPYMDWCGTITFPKVLIPKAR